MGSDITTKLQNFQSPQQAPNQPTPQQIEMGILPSQAPAPPPSGKNQLAPGTPGSTLQGPPALPGESNAPTAKTPLIGNDKIALIGKIAQILQNRKPGLVGRQYNR